MLLLGTAAGQVQLSTIYSLHCARTLLFTVISNLPRVGPGPSASPTNDAEFPDVPFLVYNQIEQLSKAPKSRRSKSLSHNDIQNSTIASFISTRYLCVPQPVEFNSTTVNRGTTEWTCAEILIRQISSTSYVCEREDFNGQGRKSTWTQKVGLRDQRGCEKRFYQRDRGVFSRSEFRNILYFVLSKCVVLQRTLQCFKSSTT